MRELNRLDKMTQLQVLAPLSSIEADALASPREPLGTMHRGGVQYYRLRVDDHRIYFEVRKDTLHTHYILHRNSLTDFLFRSKLPVTEEQLWEQESSFWKYLESLNK